MLGTSATTSSADFAKQKMRYELTMETLSLTQADFRVTHLPGRPYPTPLKYPQYHRSLPRVLYRSEEGKAGSELSFVHAGPHTLLHFNPPETTIAIVTCGGLCPGLNDVIRALTLFSLEAYKVKRVLGYRFGYMGILKGIYVDLNADLVRNINQSGGSFLGSSRGYGPDEYAKEMVENLAQLGVNVLFTVGGDGTQQGAQALVEEIARQGRDIAVVGIPKTIDNDVAFIQRTFGFSTGVEFAVQCLRAAQIEARSQLNGVCIVKLDGRLSGFVAAQAAVSFGGAHIVLIPENPVDLPTIKRLVDANFMWRQYCVIVVAVGFGQSIRPDLGVSYTGEKLGDIGAFLRDEIEEHMKSKFKEYTVRYIDPGYLVRSNKANALDAAFCLQLANHAVHEGLNGSTGCLIGSWNDRFTAVPIKLAISVSRQVDLDSELWRSVREITVGLPPSGGEMSQQATYQTGLLPTEEGRTPSPAEGMDGSLTVDPAALQFPPSSMPTMEEVTLQPADFQCQRLPGCPYPTPLRYDAYYKGERVLYQPQKGGDPELSFERALPHDWLHFNPSVTTIGIVTCGGLCPGLNDVIRAITLFSTECYGVKRVFGFKHGWYGVMEDSVVTLTKENVKNIKRYGGSFLGSSRFYRPEQFAKEIADRLERSGVDILFVVGGEDVQRGAAILVDEITRQGKDIAVVGIPKTIVNDLGFVQRTFGFTTAVEFAVHCLTAAQYEARSQQHGVCIVKLDDKRSGFVTAQAAVAFGAAHVILIPESPLALPDILALVEENFRRRMYCIIAVASGFGQSISPDLGISPTGEKLGDPAVFLKAEIEKHLKERYEEYTVRLIDPGFLIRSRPAGAADQAFCLQLANHAVHQGLYGSTGVVMGTWSDCFTLVPMKLATSVRRQVDLGSDLWRTVKEITVQRPEDRFMDELLHPPELEDGLPLL
eukprot:EG_transcript_1546